MFAVRSLKCIPCFNLIMLLFWGLFSAITFADQRDSEKYYDMVKGNFNSDNTIIEYASFTCPHCATFHLSLIHI